MTGKSQINNHFIDMSILSFPNIMVTNVNWMFYVKLFSYIKKYPTCELLACEWTLLSSTWYKLEINGSVKIVRKWILKTHLSRIVTKQCNVWFCHLSKLTHRSLLYESPVCLSVRPSTWLTACLSVCLSVCPSEVVLPLVYSINIKQAISI